MDNNFRGFKDSQKLTDWVRYFLYLQVIVELLSIISGYMEFNLLTDMQNGVYESQDQAIADAESNDARQGIVAVIYMIVYFVSAFLILKWIYRANYNTRQLGAENMKFSPGWSVGWYFVPIFSFWKPYEAMKEIWHASHNPKNWNAKESNLILSSWWTFFLATNFISQAAIRLSLKAEEISELLNVTIIYLISDIAGIPLALITLSLITSIYRAQVSHIKSESNPGNITNTNTSAE